MKMIVMIVALVTLASCSHKTVMVPCYYADGSSAPPVKVQCLRECKVSGFLVSSDFPK